MPQFIVRNYLAVKEVKLNVKGLTTLTGDSNSGKSSTLKAIDAACHNRFMSGQVRWGEDKIVVKINVRS